MVKDEAEICERVLDQGMDIVVLRRFGTIPVSAYLVQFTPAGHQEELAAIPIPAYTRADMMIPRVWPERPMDYGVHS